MESFRRFDVAVHRGVAMVTIESDLLPPDPAIVVIPLLADYPAVPLLNPVLRLEDGRQLVLATRLIASVRRGAIRRIGSVSDQGERITRAIDILMAGV
ncbi:CcdB family protein [Frigidibacter oleivorans]|uniref:CcdB family protein n=1 Tax=Frigidibacter oleivorans TaxID=2487129 RepID=UPI00197A7ED2|nr:CcdB family protein [Frigidibacter oleivorans]